MDRGRSLNCARWIAIITNYLNGNPTIYEQNIFLIKIGSLVRFVPTRQNKHLERGPQSHITNVLNVS